VAATLQAALIWWRQSEHGWQHPASALMRAACPARQCAFCSKVGFVTVLSAVMINLGLADGFPWRGCVCMSLVLLHHCGLAPGGVHFAGRADLMAAVGARLAAPGIGTDAGGVPGTTMRILFQGVCAFVFCL
jgi:hypothetical protein